LGSIGILKILGSSWRRDIVQSLQILDDEETERKNVLEKLEIGLNDFQNTHLWKTGTSTN
jgi:hypothetical protein